MKAQLLLKQRRIEDVPLSIGNVRIGNPGAGELLIRVTACGVCHTDLHIVEGDIPLKRSPIIPGHEIIGRVEKTGRGVKNFKIGDRVGIPWLYSACGRCSFCKKGMENLCESARFTGWDVDGGYAEFFISKAEFTYKIPKAFDDYHAAPLMCAGVVGYRAYKLSEIQKDQILGLWGFGASAHIIIQLAIHNGIEVLVFTRSEEHKGHAKKLGASWAGSAGEKPPKLLDSSIIFAPRGELVPIALEHTKKGGTVASSCIYMNDVPKMSYERHLYHEKRLISVANSTRADVKEFLGQAAKAKVKTDIEIFPFKEANKALLALKESKVRGAAVLTFK